MLRAIQSLYDGYECSVRVSGSLTAWFGAQKGLKQGCVLSPTLFNIYINTLATMIKNTGLGVKFGDEIINILLYADDVVLLASNAKDLQMLLDVFNDWSRQWRIVLNPKKSSVVVFRRPCDKQPDYVFKCGNDIITYASEYRYLGLVLNEHLNWDKSVKCLAQAAGRALGTLVAKSKLMGGFDYHIYTEMFNALVRPILEYSAEILGYRDYQQINNIFHRACRSFLMLPKQTPLRALQGDMGWVPPFARQQGCLARYWTKLSKTDDNRLIHRIVSHHNTATVNNWVNRVKSMFRNIGCGHLCDQEIVSRMSQRTIAKMCTNEYFTKFTENWYNDINNDGGRRGVQRNKLRTYRLFKEIYQPETYVTMPVNKSHRRALALIRTGVAPIKIETERYSRNGYVMEQDRHCSFCGPGHIEDETHVMVSCPLYDDLRHGVFNDIFQHDTNFFSKDDTNKLITLMNCQELVRDMAKLSYEILKRHNDYTYFVNSVNTTVTNRSVMTP